MDFITFPVSSTNIFPAANGKNGSQLVTEFNLRSRESVGVGPYNADSAVQYTIGPSYIHSESDFYVTGSSSELVISEGKGVINGHFIELLTPITIDLVEANAIAVKNGNSPLKGKLSVGLRVFYSTEATMNGSMLTESADNEYYTGIQVVILPQPQFKLPIDSPKNANGFNAHIKLADFSFTNSSIKSITQNPYKCKVMSASRIADIDESLSGNYLSKYGLDAGNLYIFAGKGSYTNAQGKVLDTWCKAQDSLIIWDAEPKVGETYPTIKEATFTAIGDNVALVLPHKQVDYDPTNPDIKRYFQPKQINLPAADYVNGTAGIVTSKYTDNIKALREMLMSIYHVPNGRMVYYINRLESREYNAEYPDVCLPLISSTWRMGDYVLVSEDATMMETVDNESVPPSTMYVLLERTITGFLAIPALSVGASGYEAYTQEALDAVDYKQFLDTKLFEKTLTDNEFDKIYYSPDGTDNKQFDMSAVAELCNLSSGTMCIVGSCFKDNPNKYCGDYILLHHGNKHYYFHAVVDFTNDVRRYSLPIVLSRGVPYAQIELTGGFRNVDATSDVYQDLGYVARDDAGHLRLVDYALLRSGTLAYQLGEDVDFPAGYSIEEIQANLDEYVNQRIAFPNIEHINEVSEGEGYNNININLPISKDEDSQTINIYAIDSRFNTAVTINISGDVDSNTIINISDCQKVKIIVSEESSPTINLYRSCLYYDADIINRLSVIRDMTLWYERESDTDEDLSVNYLTVKDNSPMSTSLTVDGFSEGENVVNDVHFGIGVNEITFNSSGEVVGMGIVIADSSTENVDDAARIILSKAINIPQGVHLKFPERKIIKPITISGNFVSSYAKSGGFIVNDIKFTMLSQYMENTAEYSAIRPGYISIYTSSETVSDVLGAIPAGDTEVVMGMDTNRFHTFKGWC